ncbi:MAG TPA: hypothetical protein VLX92_04850 [Kofleriaceae bacterium]|nr:hypothetical protein [Kofleriaceae bacterium]
MNKLIMLLAVVTLSTAVGCKKKDEATKDQNPPAAKTTEPDKTQPTTPPPAEPAKTDTNAAPAAPAATGDMPKECQDYKAAIDKLSSCDKLPQQTRDALKQAYDQASAGWEKLPADQKAGLASACKAGADAVTQSAKTTCGW